VVLLATELLAFGRNVHPETTLSADGARSLDLKPDLVVGLSDCWKVDVVAYHVWRAIVPEWEEVDILGVLLHWSHDESSRRPSELSWSSSGTEKEMYSTVGAKPLQRQKEDKNTRR